MDGLFVRKHALAASRHHRIDVLFIKPEPGLSTVQWEEHEEGNLHEHYLYYPYSRHRIVRLLRFTRMFKRGFKRLFKENGKPDLVHLHVITIWGIMALWIKLRYRIPYVVTEHWSRYLRGNFNSRLDLRLSRYVAKKARCIMPVSYCLQKAMQDCGLRGNYKVVPNVVDDFFFRGLSPAVISTPKTILHICCFDEASKNNFGLLRGIKKLLQFRTDFRLIMIGDGKDRAATQAYANSLDLSEGKVVFAGKMQPEDVKKAFSACSFMVLFSNYETQSVVICEALACGKPVVATHAGGIPEMVNESNGLLVEPGDEDALCSALNRMLDTYSQYSPEEISRQAQRFSFEQVGKQLNLIYLEAIKTK